MLDPDSGRVRHGVHTCKFASSNRPGGLADGGRAVPAGADVTETRTTVDRLLADPRAQLDRLEPNEAMARVRDGAILVDIRSDAQRVADGVVPGAVYVPRNVLEWRADPESGHTEP